MNNQNTYKHQHQKGMIALITILGVGFLALTAVIAISIGAFSGLVRNSNAVFGKQSFYTAEAAVNEGMYQRLGSATYVNSSAPLLNGTLAGTISLVDLPSYRVEIKGIVTNNRTERRVIKTFTLCPACEAFTYGVYSAGGGITLTGGSTVNGDVYSANSINLNGTSQINGNAEAVNAVSGSNVSGSSISGASVVPAPSIDYVTYLTKAQDDGTYFTKSKDADDFFKSPTSNAIVYLNFTSSASVKTSSFTGIIVSETDLSLQGTFNAATNYPAIISKGSLKMQGNTTINGIAIVAGEMNNTGNNNVINGSLIFLNPTSNVKITGGMIVNYDPTYFQNIENMVGFSVSMSGSTVKFLNWKEE